MVHRTVFRRLLELEHELFGVLCDIPLACCLFFSVYIFLWGASFPICVAIFFFFFYLDTSQLNVATPSPS